MQHRTLVAVLLGLGMIGSFAVIAQQFNAKAVAGPTVPPPMAVPVPPSDESALPPAAGSPLPLASAEELQEVPLPEAPREALLPGARLEDPFGPGGVEPPSDDPMEVLKSFHQQSRAKAEEQIKSLTKEADTLRARLQKVEAALEGWKTISAALETEPGAGPGLTDRRSSRKPVVLPPLDPDSLPVDTLPPELPPPGDAPR